MTCQSAPTTDFFKPPPKTDRWLELAVALTTGVRVGRAAPRCPVDVAVARQKTVAYACRAVEQRRDDPAIDRMLHVLTDFCRDVAGCRT